MTDPIIGATLGGILRLAPEFFKFFDRKNERKHELALGEQQLALLKAQGNTRIAELSAQGDTTALEALRDAIRAQGTPTGIRWVDALSATVRPVWTYLVLLTWATVKYTNVGMAIAQGANWTEVQGILWAADDAAMLSTLATFWFLDRVIRRGSRS